MTDRALFLVAMCTLGVTSWAGPAEGRAWTGADGAAPAIQASEPLAGRPAGQAADGAGQTASAAVARPAARAADDEANPAAYSFTFENDTFFDTDRHYTYGVELEYSQRWSADPRGEGAVSAVLCQWLGCAGQPLAATRHRLGQIIYTPQYISVAAPQPQDIPWGAMIYYAQDLHFLSGDGRTLTTLTGQLGVTGPAALGEQTQKWVHQHFRGGYPRGWSNQIEGELGVMAAVERRMALGPALLDDRQDNGWRTAAHWRVGLGNLMTFAGAGLSVSWGQGLPAVPMRGQELNLAPLALQGSAPRHCLWRAVACSLSAGVEARWMLRNVFIDGPAFRPGPSVGRAPLVVDASLALRLDLLDTRSRYTGSWYVQFRATHRSAEYRSDKPSQWHSFGAVTVGTMF